MVEGGVDLNEFRRRRVKVDGCRQLRYEHTVDGMINEGKEKFG